MVRFAVIFAALGLAACTGFSPEKRTAVCGETDWWQFGMTDGTFGVPVSRRAEQFADCAELGRPADVAAYRDGHDRGLQDYCTEVSGYREGYEARTYAGVCPPDLERAFLVGYRRGEDERPGIGLRPNVGVGIGIGSGGIRPRVGIGLSTDCLLFC